RQPLREKMAAKRGKRRAAPRSTEVTGSAWRAPCRGNQGGTRARQWEQPQHRNAAGRRGRHWAAERGRRETGTAEQGAGEGRRRSGRASTVGMEHHTRRERSG